MSLIILPYIFSSGTTIIASQTNSNNSTFLNIINGGLDNSNLTGTAGITYANLTLTGNIVNADISTSAAIAYSKLNVSSSIKLSDLASALSLFLVPSGGIIMWSGSIATIPSGWVLCNGSNSTPDLRNRFIVCADADVTGVAESTVTGSAAQSGSGQLPSTTVTSTIGGNVVSANGGGSTFTSTQLAFSSHVNQNLVPISANFGTGSNNVAVFFSLAYIMKT